MRNELKIGWVLLVALGLVFGFLGWLKHAAWFTSGNRISVWFPDVSGVRIGDPVSIYGKICGTLEALESPGQDSIGWIAILSLDHAPRLSSDAMARLQVREITGGRIIDLDPGVSEKPFTHEVLRGETALDIGTFLRELKPVLAFFRSDTFQQVMVEGGKLITRLGTIEPESTLENLNQALNHLSRLSVRAEQLMADPSGGDRPLLSEIRTTLQQVQLLADSVRPVLSELSHAGLSGTLREGQYLIQDGRATLAYADSLLKHKMQDSTTIAGAMLNARELKTELDKTLKGLQETLQLIREGRLKARIRF